MAKDLNGTPLHAADLTREMPVDESGTGVITATFQLTEHDHRLLNDLYIDEVPQSVTMNRDAGGRAWFLQSEGRLPMTPGLFFTNLRSDLESVGRAAGMFNRDQRSALDSVRSLLDNLTTGPWGDEQQQTVTQLIKVLRALPRRKQNSQTSSILAALELVDGDGIFGRGGPFGVMQQALLKVCPEFLLFSQSDRMLQTTYDLADEDAPPPRALQNLLRLGCTDVEQLRALITEGNITLLRTALRKANNALRAKLQPTWRQSELTIELVTHGTQVQVLINELHEDGVTTSLDERSEGLRAFVALMAFMHDRTGPNPPVLLIDEAESKLHLDAQADLMEVLQQQTVAQQILYTTHSLDCLPPDIGTGLRFVVPTSQHTSELRSNFWSSGKAGFRELHVMAGASRTAYSRFSRAVLTEGASEMLLLPTLIRKATGETDLFYRVAPGLSNISADSLELYDPADRVVYLVDGDGGGIAKKKALVKDGMPADRVLSLPPGKAMEDLLTIDSYLQAVNDHIADSGSTERITPADLTEGVTRSKAVDTWCRAKNIKAGKVAIAGRLLNNADQIELEPEGAAALVELHAKLTEILKP
ncbi:AAA family ATPase [Lentzea sp. NPDC051838]|uniref:ATP-dependent nuclease n=1 Tax=Lentzea sp. NPDC051838 TaxID=3154849 RepID=UPI00342F7105